MALTPPPHTQAIAQRLLAGYQFSESDRDSADLEPLYLTLSAHVEWFQTYLGLFGFNLAREENIFFLEKEGKVLSNEEKQTIVVLYLLADLWMEGGHNYSDLYTLRVPWRDLDWFRDGYGREYLAQVNISKSNGLSAIDSLWQRLARKGLVWCDSTTGSVTLRRPAERLLNMARRIHAALEAQGEHATQ